MGYTGAPCRMAEHDRKYGTLFHVPVMNLPEFLEEVVHPMLSFGFSPAFVAIFLHCHAAGITRVYFDADAGVINQLPTFEWAS